MHAIYKDRDEHDRQQAELKKREDDARAEERKSFNALLQEAKGLFVHEESLASEERNQIIGGDSFLCFLVRS
jgi:hypothetical protein